MMDEDQQNWKEMTNTMSKINKKKQRKYSTLFMLWISLMVKSVVTLTHFGQSVFLLTIFKNIYKSKAYPKWHSWYQHIPNFVTFKVLLTEYKMTCNNFHSFVCQILKSYAYLPSTMYLFMKAARFTYLNFEGTTECRITYNHWRKTTKNGNEWKNFARSQNLQARTQIIFEFPDATPNFVLFWICL
ncbi:hypothetical protein HKD37_15G044145 [Glycine soja]